MTIWFEGNNEIDCGIEQVKRAVEDPGAHFAEVTRLMPGLASVELVEQGGDAVIIKTNEGLMTRTDISTASDTDRVTLSFAEEYMAGKVTATSHFTHEFTSSGGGVSHHLVISDVNAPGFLGFLYRKFGSAKMGKAFLGAYQANLEGVE